MKTTDLRPRAGRGESTTVRQMDAAERDRVRLAALRALLKILAEQGDGDGDDPALVALVLDGADERGMCAALGVSRDEVRARLIRLAL